MSKQYAQDWLAGRASLGAAAGWTAEEMRVVADLGFALAEQGCDDEALTIFEGLAALASATAYFQIALGAICLRLGQTERAIEYLDTALATDTRDVTALVNRGEAHLQLHNFALAERDLRLATSMSPPQTNDVNNPVVRAITRARALLATLPARNQITDGADSLTPRVEFDRN